jgi:hypothetical protein
MRGKGGEEGNGGKNERRKAEENGAWIGEREGKLRAVSNEWRKG